VTETKIKVKKGKKGSLNTHYNIKINDALIIGTIYVPNEMAEKNPDVKEFEIEIPFEVPEDE
jgi:hypothetical protein